MWNRACPLCFVKLSPFLALSASNDLTCPACHAPVELSRHSRVLSSFVGIVVALPAFYLTSTAIHLARWIFPMIAAFLAFGCASALMLFIRSDLVVPPHQDSSIFPHPPS
jgi:hypothetical protein